MDTAYNERSGVSMVKTCVLGSTWWLIDIHHVQNQQAASVTDLLELQVWPCASCLRVGHCKALIMFEET